MVRRPKKIFFIFAILITVSTAGLVFANTAQIKKQVPLKTNLAKEIAVERPQKREKLEFVSPDAQYVLNVVESTAAEEKMLRTFYLTKSEDTTPVKILQEELDVDESIVVPENTFSPKNEYVFVKYNGTEDVRYIVLRADGEEMQPGKKLIEIVGIFAENYPDYEITEVTGWGSYDLLIVNTNKKDGEIGPSWWFDVTNSNFTKLNTRFN